MAVLTGDASAVTSQAMIEESTRTLQHRRNSAGHRGNYHTLSPEIMQQYCDELASMAHLPRMAPHYASTLKTLYVRGIFSYLTLKQLRYSLEAGGQVKEWRDGREVNTNLELTCLVVRGFLYLAWLDFPRFVNFAFKMLRQKLGI